MLIFLHISKTGGGTVRRIMRQQYRYGELFEFRPERDPASAPCVRYLRGEGGVPWEVAPGAEIMA